MVPNPNNDRHLGLIVLRLWHDSTRAQVSSHQCTSDHKWAIDSNVCEVRT